MTPSPAVTGRPTLPLMRLVLGIGVVFVTGAGVQLYVLGDRTEQFFAWTIADPLSAAALGGFYLTATVVAGLALAQREWARARVGVPGILVFLWLMVLASGLHLEVFHLQDGPGSARAAAWLWLVIYVVDPPLATLAYLRQRRAPGPDAPRRLPAPRWFGAGLLAAAVPVLVLGVALVLRPTQAGGSWAWPLTPLVAQALGAWLVGLGLLLVAAARERDWERMLPASAGLVVLCVVQLGALVRFDRPPDGVVGWTWVVLLVLLGLGGAVATGARLSAGRAARRS